MEKIIIACDFFNKQKLIDFLKPFSDKGIKLFLKLGLEIVYSLGLEIITELKAQGHKIFLDLKLCDIPNTVSQALKALAKYKPDYVTIHLSGGKDMVYQALQALKKTDVQLIGVSVLTSLDDNDVQFMFGESSSTHTLAATLIALGYEAGIRNFVSSSLEVPIIKNLYPTVNCFCPGIRQYQSKGDQKRIVTPQEAYALGADFIVVGREITAAHNPLATYQAIVKAFNQ